MAEVIRPVVKEVTYHLAHVPNLVRHGSKLIRDLQKEPNLLPQVLSHLRTFEEALAYPPHQAYIGAIDPDELNNIEMPWFNYRPGGALPSGRVGPYGEITPEDEFLGMIRLADDFELIMLEEGFAKEMRAKLSKHPYFTEKELEKLNGHPLSVIESKIATEAALPLHVKGDQLVGCCLRGHEEDLDLLPHFLLDNFGIKVGGAMALRYLLKGKNPENVEYLIGCGEESVGDRYNRAGGSLSKAMGEMAWCVNATGSDTKAFCTGPVHALTVASAFIASGTYKDVVVVAGGCMHKLGMKSRGHLSKDMPLVEDVMAGIAVRMGPDDGVNPVIRLDSIGRHIIAAAGTAQAIMQNIVAKPLDRLGFKMTDIDKYATELHNPECTEPAGSGNVPKTNYRTLASFAVLRKDIEAKDLDKFATQRGMPGFSPTQGHIASAVPYLGFAREKMLKGEMQRSMFFAKGSLFLGRMTQLSDGISFILERNDGRGA